MMPCREVGRITRRRIEPGVYRSMPHAAVASVSADAPEPGNRAAAHPDALDRIRNGAPRRTRSNHAPQTRRASGTRKSSRHSVNCCLNIPDTVPERRTLNATRLACLLCGKCPWRGFSAQFFFRSFSLPIQPKPEPRAAHDHLHRRAHRMLPSLTAPACAACLTNDRLRCHLAPPPLGLSGGWRKSDISKVVRTSETDLGRPLGGRHDVAGW